MKSQGLSACRQYSLPSSGPFPSPASPAQFWLPLRPPSPGAARSQGSSGDPLPPPPLGASAGLRADRRGSCWQGRPRRACSRQEGRVCGPVPGYPLCPCPLPQRDARFPPHHRQQFLAAIAGSRRGSAHRRCSLCPLPRQCSLKGLWRSSCICSSD